MKEYTKCLSFFLLAISCLKGDTGDLQVTGNLDVIHGGLENKGNLSVDGDVGLSVTPTPYLPNDLTLLGLSEAFYYGPIQVGERTQKAEFSFANEDVSNKKMLNIPLGRIPEAGSVKIFVNVWQNGNIDGASFELYGSRQSNVRSLSHTAYGAARFLKLKGRMHHGRMELFFDIDTSSSDNRGGITQVNVVVQAEAASYWFDKGTLLAATEILPVLTSEYELRKGPHEQQGTISAITGAWRGTDFEFHGNVRLVEKQGDVSMGVFGP